MKVKTLYLIILIILSEGLNCQGNSFGRHLTYISASGINSGYFVYNPKIANLNDSGYVVVWYDGFSDVIFQRFAADGTRIGSANKILNNYKCQNVGNIASASNGDYYISLSDYNKFCNYGTSNYFKIKRFNNQDSLISEYEDALAGNYAKWTGIAVLKNGNIASCYNNTNNKIVYSILNNTLTLISSSLVDNGSTSDRCEVAALQNGDFLVSYHALNNSNYCIAVSIYQSSGTFITSVIPSENLPAEQKNPFPAALSNGGFVITWDGNSLGVLFVYARLYNSSYTASGAEFKVNTNSYHDYHYPSVLGLSTGGFVIAFGNYVSSEWNIFIKEYGQNSIALYNLDIQANTFTPGIQKFPSITNIKNERYVIAYVSGSNSDILLDVASDIENPTCTDFTQRIDKDTTTLIVFTNNVNSKIFSSSSLQLKLKSLPSAGTLINSNNNSNLVINTVYDNNIVNYSPVSNPSVTFEFFSYDSYGRLSIKSCIATIKVCYMSCNTCTGVGDAVNQRCSSCKTGYFPLSDITTRCYTSTTVLDGYFFNITNFGKCSSNCKTCQSGTVCTLCNDNYFLHLVDSKCYSLCPDGFFNDIITKRCKSCITNCKTCPNDSQCNVCNSGSYLYSQDKKCYTTCPNGFFENSSLTPNQCDSCPSNCKKCSNKNTCTICFDSFYLYSDNKCYAPCPNGNYGNTSNGLCSQCPGQCATCTSFNVCTSCQTNYYLYGNGCNTSCPYTYFANKSNNKCTACPDNCKTCSDADTCTLCNTNYFLHLVDNLCYDVCPTTFYGNKNSYRCEGCIANCAICSNTTACQSCNTDYYLYLQNYKCYQPCPVGFYGDTTTNICTKCPIYYLDGTNICVDRCPVTYYLDSLTGICKKCQTNCDGCVDPIECNFCKINYFNLNKEECKTILAGYWGNYETRKWNACPNNCVTCFGPMKCSKCKPNYFFLPQDSKMCGDCPIGYYGDPITRRCTKCIENCDRCGNDKECIDCSNGYVLFNKKCWSMCTDGYYVDTQLKACVKCNSACSKCKNNSDYCIECAEGTFYYNKQVPYEGISRQCVTACPSNYYPNDKRECVICKDKNQFLMSNRCAYKCDEGFYKNMKEYTCIPCNQPDQYKLRDKCVSGCPDNTFIDNQNRCINLTCGNQCKNGGKCAVLNHKIKCYCEDKYSGDFCEIFTPEIIDLIDVDEPLSSDSLTYIQDLYKSYLKDQTGLSIRTVEKVTDISIKQPDLIESKEINADPRFLDVYEAAINLNQLIPKKSNPNLINHISNMKESMSKYVDLLIKGVNNNNDLSVNSSLFSIQVSGLSSNNNQKSNRLLATTKNNSKVDATECIKVLKAKYKIPDSQSLIIKKIDFSNELIANSDENSIKYSNSVIYEFFSPIDKSKLNVEHCNNVLVTIKAPNTKITSNINIEFYMKLLKSNLDMFDAYSPAFQDHCVPIRDPSTEKDATLEYRIKNYYKNYLAKCPDKCNYKGLDNESYVICLCNGMFLKEQIANWFVSQTIYPPSILNQEIIKCPETYFKSPDIFKNAGFYVGLILFLLGLIFYISKKSSGINLIKTNFREIIDNDCNYFDMKRLYARDYFEANKVNFILFEENVKNLPPAANTRISSIGFNIYEKKSNAKVKSDPFKSSLDFIEDKTNSTKLDNKDQANSDDASLKLGKNKMINNKAKISSKNDQPSYDEKDMIKKAGTSDQLELEENSPSYQDIINYNGQPLPTTRDYKCTSPYITARFDNRNFTKMLFYYLVDEHVIFRLIYQKSLINPAWLELYLLCFKLNVLFASNAILFLDSYITKRAENPSKDAFSLAFTDELVKTILSLAAAIILTALFSIIVLVPGNVESEFNKALITRKENTIKQAYKMKFKYTLLVFLTSLFNIFFWYYGIAFCGIYVSTSIGWIYGSIAGLIIDWFFLSFIIPLFRTLVRMCMKSMKLFICLEYLFWKTKSIRR